MPNLTKVADISPHIVNALLDRAEEYRMAHRRGERLHNILGGKVVALIFEKPSLRTKVAFEVATHALGGVPIFLSSSQILASAQNEPGRESIPDIAHNLERMADILVARVYEHQTITTMAQSVKIPVINALCDQHHPSQALADLMTIQTHIKKPAGDITVAFVGDGNNVATSLMQICALMGVSFVIASPAGYELPQAEVAVAQAWAKVSGCAVRLERDPQRAVTGADVVYTDTFVSMGQEAEHEQRLRAFQGYQVTKELLAKANPQAIFMHCLPAHRGEEVTNEVMDCPQSVIFDQSECRLHIAKALIEWVVHDA